MRKLSRGVIIVPLSYSLPAGCGTLQLSSHVLTHFESFKQQKFYSREAGGQLFATFNDPSLMGIVEATGPRRTDKRSVFSYKPDRVAENLEIRERFARDLHFVGDWHTHRQHAPSPSTQDTDSILESVHLSSHNLVGFVLIIVGQAQFPAGLHVSFHSKAGSRVCHPQA